MRLLAAPDKFRGTLTARQAAAAIAAGAERAGWDAVQLPLADGGEGTLDVLGGGNRRTVVTGPLGEPVEAEWRLEDDGTALIEAALACGLTLAGGRGGQRSASCDEPRRRRADRRRRRRGRRANRRGRGRSRVDRRRRRRHEACRVRSLVPLEVACDVDARFLDAADVFAPQKGATPGAGADPARAAREARSFPTFRDPARREVSPAGSRRSARSLVPGFDSRRRAPRLRRTARRRSTSSSPARGLVDATSLTGKVVGRVLDSARTSRSRSARGGRRRRAGGRIDAVSLVERYGPERALAEPAECLAEIVETALAGRRN